MAHTFSKPREILYNMGITAESVFPSFFAAIVCQYDNVISARKALERVEAVEYPPNVTRCFEYFEPPKGSTILHFQKFKHESNFGFAIITNGPVSDEFARAFHHADTVSRATDRLHDIYNASYIDLLKIEPGQTHDSPQSWKLDW